ncbi:polymorphic toxin-type HINT domain-containing protein [Streptomyces sp. NPDC047022]|uniref:polymorphic toxin-type HINT domain-containing protein n=1 Tax=Streptomyces sp. NPDC047022 TaxID=3155737 RepID=UPI0033DBE062
MSTPPGSPHTLTLDTTPVRGPPHHTKNNTSAAQRQTLTTTWHHPFWDATHHRWTDAHNLTPGTKLRQPDGTTITIHAVHNFHQHKTTYDLTVNNLHTYYVLAGATPVLVHNCGTVDLYRVSPRDRGASELDNGVLPENHPLDLDEGLDGSAYFGNRQRVEDYASQHRDTHGQGFRVTVPSRWLRENDIEPMEDFLNEGAVEYAIPRHLFDEFNSFPRAPWNPGGR